MISRNSGRPQQHKREAQGKKNQKSCSEVDRFRQLGVGFGQPQVACVADVYFTKQARERNCERVQTTKRTGRGACLLAGLLDYSHWGSSPLILRLQSNVSLPTGRLSYKIQRDLRTSEMKVDVKVEVYCIILKQRPYFLGSKI